MPTVRSAVSEDLPQLVEYNIQLALETEAKVLDPATVERGVRKLLADPNKGFYFVADHEGKAVGQVLITLEWSDWRDGWFWWIQSVYVHQDWRNQGVLRSIFEAIRQQAQKQGDVVGLRLYVEKENLRAQRTYEKLGLHQGPYFFYEREPL